MDLRINKGKGFTPLLIACLRDHLETVRALLSTEAKVDLQEDDGATPLHVACQQGHAEVARALLSAGAKADLQNLVGASPLFVACQQGHVEAARALLSAGGKVDLQDNRGCSPLQCACYTGHMGLVRALISAGRGQTCAKNGWTPLDVTPPALRPEEEQLMQRVMEERALAHGRGASNVGPGASALDPGVAALDPAHGHDHDKPAGSQLQPGCQGGGAPLKVVMAICRLRVAEVTAGQGRRSATARQSARRSTGGRAATRRHAHGCVIPGRGGVLPGGEASSWSLAGCGPNSDCAEACQGVDEMAAG